MYLEGAEVMYVRQSLLGMINNIQRIEIKLHPLYSAFSFDKDALLLNDHKELNFQKILPKQQISSGPAFSLWTEEDMVKNETDKSIAIMNFK